MASHLRIALLLVTKFRMAEDTPVKAVQVKLVLLGTPNTPVDLLVSVLTSFPPFADTVTSTI